MNYWDQRQTNDYPPDCFWCGPDGPCDGGCHEEEEEATLADFIPVLWARELERSLRVYHPPWYVPPTPEEAWQRRVHWRRVMAQRYWRERQPVPLLRFAEVLP